MDLRPQVASFLPRTLMRPSAGQPVRQRSLYMRVTKENCACIFPVHNRRFSTIGRVALRRPREPAVSADCTATIMRSNGWRKRRRSCYRLAIIQPRPSPCPSSTEGTLMPAVRGRQFFNNPGPTNIPDRVLRAMDRPVLDFMSDEFLAIQHACHAGVKRVLKTDQTLYMYNASGHGAWEAALANLFSAGDTVLIVETGYFSESWAEMAVNLGIKVETFTADWRKGADITRLAERLAKDKAHEIKAVLTVHNETATGMVLPVAEIRRAMDEAKHPALLLSDTISSLASMEYKMDAWGIDVTVGGSQKGLMLPTGMSLTGVSNKALETARKNKAPRHYWNWELMNGRAPQKFMGTAPVHMFFGLHESLKMIEEEGLDAVFQRHTRLGEATREAVRAW